MDHHSQLQLDHRPRLDPHQVPQDHQQQMDQMNTPNPHQMDQCTLGHSSRLDHQLAHVGDHGSRLGHQMGHVHSSILDHQMEDISDHSSRLGHQIEHVNNQSSRLNHQMEHASDHINHISDQSGRLDHHMDHVDGHTLSTVPLSVGCPDPSLLSNIFQDTVSEGFIDFVESGSQQSFTGAQASFLTTVSTVFASNVFSVASPQMPGSISSPQFTGSSTYPILRTPVYSADNQHQPFSGSIQESLVFSTDNGGQFTSQTPVYNLDVQELDCINLNQIKSSDLDLPPLMLNSVQDSRLTVLSSTWTAELGGYLSTGVWGDLTVRAFNPSSDFQSVGCHKLMLGAISPVIKHWLTDIAGADDDPCIILPDFSSDEIEDFLRVIYLSSNQSTNSFLQVLRCLNGVDSPEKLETQLKDETSQALNVHLAVEEPNLKPEDRLLKGEDRKRSKVEVKMEEQDLEKLKTKLKKILEDKQETKDDKAAATSSIQPKETKPKKQKGPFACAKCGKLFKVWRILKEHENLHAEPKFKCSIEGCVKKFHTKSNLKSHVDVVHHKKKDLPCEVCGKLFYNASLLKAHSETHNPDKLYCSHCPAAFASTKTLKIHIRTKHTTEENVPKCYICQKTLASENVLRQHIARVHFHEKNFVCVHCGKAFYENTELKAHLATHAPPNQNENISCQMCETKFKNQKNLRSHIKTVHGNLEKKHVCHLCGKPFTNRYRLNRHMDGHRQKTVACVVCNKNFSSEERVNEHNKKVHQKWKKDKKIGLHLTEVKLKTESPPGGSLPIPPGGGLPTPPGGGLPPPSGGGLPTPPGGGLHPPSGGHLMPFSAKLLDPQSNTVLLINQGCL